jgi:hypothetical protein
MYLAVKGLPDPPYVLCYVRPEGADTAMPGVLNGVDLTDLDAALERLKIGAPVATIDERRGRITDIRFELV